jgi:hypothetical protein
MPDDIDLQAVIDQLLNENEMLRIAQYRMHIDRQFRVKHGILELYRYCTSTKGLIAISTLATILIVCLSFVDTVIRCWPKQSTEVHNER